MEIRKKTPSIPNKQPLKAATSLGQNSSLRHPKKDKSPGSKALLYLKRYVVYRQHRK